MKTAEEMHQEIQPLVENGWNDAAISAYEKLLVAHPEFAQGHFELGMLHLKNGDDDNAFQHLESAASLDTENAEYKKIVADFYYTKKSETEKAYEIYRELTGMKPEDAETHFVTGNLAVALHRFEDAMDLYQKVVELEPWHAEAAEYLEKLRNHTGAAGKPKSADEMYAKSQELMNAGDETAARTVLERLVDTHPDFALGHNDLGVLCCREGDVKGTQQYFEKAAALAPEDPTIQKNLAEFYYVISGDYTKALEIGLKVLKDNPNDAEMLMMAGHMSYALKRSEDARLFYNRVLEIEPWNHEAGDSIAKLDEEAAENDDLSAASV